MKALNWPGRVFDIFLPCLLVLGCVLLVAVVVQPLMVFQCVACFTQDLHVFYFVFSAVV